MATCLHFSAIVGGWKRLESLESAQRFNVKMVQRISASSDQTRFEIKGVSYRPPGTQLNILNEVSFSFCTKSLGLIFGQSGSGKTTLLQLIAGFGKPTSGSICIRKYANDDICIHSENLHPGRVGMVFQFPDRYFVADTVLKEIVFGLPKQRGQIHISDKTKGRFGVELREDLVPLLNRAISWVGLDEVDFTSDPHSLSGGYQRRLALAIQLVKIPDLLILDEPLAGLDWKGRAGVIRVLKVLKKEVAILVVSHDLKELAEVVDNSWEMKTGGFLDKIPISDLHLTCGGT